MKKPKWLMQGFGIHKWHTPCSPTAVPPPPDRSPTGGFPVIVFSHGLGGNCDVHTGLAQLFARKGFVVVALEHECGAASYARTETGEVLTYVSVCIATKSRWNDAASLFCICCWQTRPIVV